MIACGTSFVRVDVKLVSLNIYIIIKIDLYVFLLSLELYSNLLPKKELYFNLIDWWVALIKAEFKLTLK